MSRLSSIKTEMLVVMLFMVLLASIASDAQTPLNGNQTIPISGFFTYKIIDKFPHDTGAFTEGLVYYDDSLYEGTNSSLRRIHLTTGEILNKTNLPNPNYFGEGITIFEDKLIELTWQSHIGIVYDKDTLNVLKIFNYPTEGWGLTHDGTSLIMSDGTSNLHFLNPETFVETSTVQIHDGNNPITALNELEYINGRIFANIFQQDKIAIINPENGSVTGWIHLSGISPVPDDGVKVLNGIAYDPQKKRLFLTGKNWPFLFEIQLVPVKSTPTNNQGR